MFGIGGTEWVVIGIVLLIAVGPDRLPKLIKAVVKTYRELRRATRELRASSGIDDIIRDEELKELRELRELRRPLTIPGPDDKPAADKPAPQRALTYTERMREDPPEGVDLAEIREGEDERSEEERAEALRAKEEKSAAEDAIRQAKIAAMEAEPEEPLDPEERARRIHAKDEAARRERELIQAKIAAAEADPGARAEVED